MAESAQVAGCPFCAIAEDRDPDARIVASAPQWVAFFPPEPATAGHTLVIPRMHTPDLWSAEETTRVEVLNAAVAVGRIIEQALAPDGMNLITSAGEAAEQSVFHLHLHVVPRWDTDSFGSIWPPKGRVLKSDVDRAFDRLRAVRER